LWQAQFIPATHDRLLSVLPTRAAWYPEARVPSDSGTSANVVEPALIAYTASDNLRATDETLS
jgi:hypothetical protein